RSWHLLRNPGDVAERVLVGLSIPPIRVEKTEPLAKLPRTTELKDRETRKDAERRQRQQRDKPSMTRSTTSMKRQSPSGQWLTVWESIAGRCASTSMHPNVRNPSHEADGRASSTPTATTSWPVGRKVAATRRSCTVRLSSEVIRAREPSSRTLSPRCGVVRQQNVSSAACAWDPGGFADGSPARRRSLTRMNAVSSTWSWRRHRLRERHTPSCKSSEGFLRSEEPMR